MKEPEICKIFSAFRPSGPVIAITRFCSEEDGAPYGVWKVETDREAFVLKKTTLREKAVYETFFPVSGGPVPKVYGFTQVQGETYMLMEYVDGESLSRCTRHKLTLALDCLTATQAQFWDNTQLAQVGCSFEDRYSALKKRLAYMDDLSAAYEAFLCAYCAVPRTLCNDDLLPFNFLAGQDRAVILDWEVGGILPYPSAIARLLAFGEEREDALFFMTREDRAYAIDCYYDRLLKPKGIVREEYLRTLKLFFFKEYSEWVYLARSSGDLSGPYYQKYYREAKLLAKELGY